LAVVVFCTDADFLAPAASAEARLTLGVIEETATFSEAFQLTLLTLPALS